MLARLYAFLDVTYIFQSAKGEQIMSGAKQPEWTWWEKTVEYLFVRQAKFLKIAPLDGNHEKAGDAILRNKNGKYYLVEFKEGDDEASKNREIGKFKHKEPEEPKELINNKYLKSISEAGFHFIIFGSSSSGQKLKLVARKYWDYLFPENNSRHIEFNDFDKTFRTAAIGRKKFLDYIRTFISLKEGGEEDAGNSGSGGFSFDNVLAVNEEGEFCSIMDICESKTYQNDLENSNSNNFTGESNPDHSTGKPAPTSPKKSNSRKTRGPS